MSTQDPVAGIPEDRVAMILARAAELDRSNSATLGLDAIRFAAIEAGISQAAVDQALDEYAAGARPAVREVVVETRQSIPRWRRWLRTLTSPFQLAILGVPLGMLAGADPFETMLAILAFLGIGSYLALRDRPTRMAGGYQLSIVLMFLASAFGVALMGGNEEVIGIMAMIAALLFIAGTMLIQVRVRDVMGLNGTAIEESR
jgi:hypothetical protein